MIKGKNNWWQYFLNNSVSTDPIGLDVDLFESSEPAESNRSILVEIGLVGVELFTFQIRHGKSGIYG